jgi:hypothetical protein
MPALGSGHELDREPRGDRIGAGLDAVVAWSSRAGSPPVASCID